jgi:hypothetical protein
LEALVRVSRERRALARASATPTSVDPATGVPTQEMSFEQYRLWAKLGDRIAARDYRAVEELQSDLAAQFEPSVVEAMLDATLADYGAYLADVIDRNCRDLEPESVWRKASFMMLWSSRLERRSTELAEQERVALRACGF